MKECSVRNEKCKHQKVVMQTHTCDPNTIVYLKEKMHPKTKNN